MWYLVLCFSWSVCAAFADGSSAGSCCCLVQCCRGGGFFLNSAVFGLVLGLSVLFQEFFACIPWLRFWCCLFAPYASPTFRPSPAVAGLMGFRCGPPHWFPACVCGSFLGRQSCVFFLSSCSARGWLLLSLLLEFASVPLPAAPAVFPRRVLPQVTLRGLRKLFWLQLPVLLLRWSSVCWACGVFGAALGFPPCAVLFLRGLQFCAASPVARLPFWVSAFSDTVCLTYCCAGGVGWASTLPLCSQCFSCAGWLAGVRWLLRPVSGSSHGSCDCSLGGSVVVPYGSPCL